MYIQYKDKINKTQYIRINEYVTGKSIIEILRSKYEKTEYEKKQMEEIISRIAIGEPISYILGYEYFYGRKFNVNRDVLIPRPETEGLVEIVLKHNFKTMIDIGTGSGCIAITVDLEKKEKGETNYMIDAIDISSKAISVAKKNKRIMSSQVNFFKKNLYSQNNSIYDIIVSNPPYIVRKDLEKLEVFRNEPVLALDGGEDGLDFYRKIIDYAKSGLNKDGLIFFEIGEEQAKDVSLIAKSNGFSFADTKTDLLGRDRYLIVGR